MNVDDLVAIDVHTHAEISKDGHGALSPALMEASAKYFKAGHRQPTIAENWATTLGPAAQSYGVTLPELDLG